MTELFGTATNVVTFDGVLSYTRIFNPTVDNVITFAQSLAVGRPLNSSVLSTIDFEQSLLPGGQYNIFLQDGDVPHYDPYTKIYTPHLMQYVQSLQVELISGRSLVAIIQFHQSVNVSHIKASAIDVNVSQTLTFSQVLHSSEWLINTVSFGQTVAPTISKPLENIITFGQTVSAEKVLGRTIINTLTFGSFVTFSLVNRTTPKEYKPFVGETDVPNLPMPPSATIIGPMPGITAPFELVYPSTGAVTDYVILRAPELDNRDRLAYARVNRETRGGTLIIYADPNWPKVHLLALTFTGLSYTDAHNLLTFVKAHLGKEIGLIDWESRYWKGIITNPNNPITEDHYDLCTASFEFEGELDPTWSPQILPAVPGSEVERRQHVPDVRGNVTLPIEVEGIIDWYTAITDDDIVIGTPLYLKSNNHVAKAWSDITSDWEKATVCGFSIVAASAGATIRYVAEGQINMLDWTAIIGTASLTPGGIYFLSLVAGKITLTAPNGTGTFVVRLGQATNTMILDIEIEQPVKL